MCQKLSLLLILVCHFTGRIYLKNQTALLLLQVISCYKLFKLENDSTSPKLYLFSDINTHYLNILINNGHLKIVNNTNSFKCVEMSAVKSFDGNFTVKC